MPAVTVDGVYVVYPCQAYDFSPATGNSVWQYNGVCEGGGGWNAEVANGLLYEAGPTGGGGGFTGQTLNAESGAIVSSFVADNEPALGTTNGYFLQSGTLRGLQLSNNTVLWSFAGDGQLVTSPILVNNDVFVGSSSGNLYALNGTTGAQLWEVNVGASMLATGTGGIPLYGLSAGDGLLVVPAGNTVTAYLLSTDP
jgi:outer membrane protein assembly factor BamB